VSNYQLALQGTRVGTPLYLSPELVKQQPYDHKIDIWALGCVFYHMAALEPPFIGDNLISLGYNIVNKAPKQLPSSYSAKLASFVKLFLEKNPITRPKIAQIWEFFSQKEKGRKEKGKNENNGETSEQKGETKQERKSVLSQNFMEFEKDAETESKKKSQANLKSILNSKSSGKINDINNSSSPNNVKQSRAISVLEEKPRLEPKNNGIAMDSETDRQSKEFYRKFMPRTFEKQESAPTFKLGLKNLDDRKKSLPDEDDRASKERKMVNNAFELPAPKKV
jgi:serine/threonine protein kinase